MSTAGPDCWLLIDLTVCQAWLSPNRHPRVALRGHQEDLGHRRTVLRNPAPGAQAGREEEAGRGEGQK